jgi:SAM-dependent methyltransferase
VNFNPANYNKDFYMYLTRFDRHLETALYAVFSHLGKPGQFLDIGCGTGVLVDLCTAAGIFARGVELSKEARDLSLNKQFILVHDLRDPLQLTYLGHEEDMGWDLVWCVEVAEHLPPESADTLCDTLAYHTDKWLVFTAAHEGQGGQWHLNEQPPEYWIEKLESRGLFYVEDKTEQLRSTWIYTTGPCHWMPENVMVFKREEGTKDDDILEDDS